DIRRLANVGARADEERQAATPALHAWRRATPPVHVRVVHTMTEHLAYKVLGTDLRSHHGGTGVWTPGKWSSVQGEIVACQRGIHYCRRDQLVQWLGPTIWLFEDGAPGETVDAGDKMVTRKGRIVEQVETWNETTARLFAADVAEVALVYIPESHRDPFVAAINAARGFAR